MLKTPASPLIAIALVCGVVGITYWSSLRAPLVFDDSYSINDNRSIRSLWPLVGSNTPLNPPAELPTSGRPLVNLSLAVNYTLGGLNPAGYHVFNIVVHILSALVLMAIVARTLRLDYFDNRFEGSASWIALAVALLWAVHPLQTETVVYVTQRTELVVGLFYLTTLYASLRYWQAVSSVSRKGWVIAATLACMAGMASKEVMVTAPVVVLLFERTFLRGSFKAAVRQSWPLYIGLALGWGLLFVLNVNMPRSLSAGFHLGLPAYVWWLTQTKVLLLYLKLAVWPWPLSIHYEMPYLTTLGGALVYLVPVAVLAIGTLLLVWRRSAVGFVGAWVLIILSPTLVVPIITEVAAERRMYLPLAALVTLAVVGGYQLARRALPQISRAALVAGGVATILVIVYSVVSIQRLAYYHDAIILWQDNLANQPNDPVAYNNLGRALVTAGDFNSGVAQYQSALQLDPHYDLAHNNLAVALTNLGQPDQAIAHYQLALHERPKSPIVHYNLANALLSTGKTDEAVAQYQEALRLDPDLNEAHNNLGSALMALGRTQEAIEQFQQAIATQPASAHLNLGLALIKLGLTDEAIAQFQQAIAYNSQSIQAYANLAQALAAANRSAEAIAAAQNALALAKSQQQPVLAQQIDDWLREYQSRPPSKTEQP